MYIIIQVMACRSALNNVKAMKYTKIDLSNNRKHSNIVKIFCTKYTMSCTCTLKSKSQKVALIQQTIILSSVPFIHCNEQFLYHQPLPFILFDVAYVKSSRHELTIRPFRRSIRQVLLF